jgi:DNA repair exonuclease SbcCD nuclease subunit
MNKPFKMFYSTDWHWTLQTPEARLDNYAESLEMEIRSFFQMGMDLDCDCYGVGGDFVDSAFLRPRSIIRLGEIIRQELQRSQKKLYYILGNHDLDAYNPNSITNTAFGVFLKFCDDSMVHLSRTPLIVNHENGHPVALSGVDSYSLIDKNVYNEANEVILPRSRDWVVAADVGIPRIHMAHGFLSPKPILDSIPHTTIEEMRHTTATVTLGAHEHGGFPITKIDNGLVCNPGALGRVFATLSEMQRMPQFMMVSIYPDGTPDLMLYKCPVSAPGDLIMNRDALDEKKAREAFLTQVRGNVEGVMEDINISAVDLRLIMGRYKENTRPAVYREAERRLGL